MFSEAVINRKLAAFKERYGWLPVEHSVSDVDKMVAHLKREGRDGIIDVSRTGNIQLKRPLTKGEKKWIANERAMCALSCTYFLTRYYWIASEAEHGKSGNIMHFSFRSGQTVFYKILQDLDNKGVSKEIFCLKARKQGISTLIEGIISWGVSFVPGVKANISSADGQKSQIMAGMLFFAIDEMPWWLEATKTRDKRASDRGILEWSHIGNMVTIQPGSMRGGMGQGTTPSFVHVSECSQYTDPVAQIDEGLMRAVTSSRGTFMVLETTGDGDDWTAALWNNCKENYFQGKARLYPVFLPWFMTPELYPSTDWIGKYKIPDDWTPAPETQAHMIKCQAYTSSTPILTEVLGKRWVLPREQAWYWEFNYFEYKRRGLEKTWMRQMPADDYEALQGDNDRAVGDDALANMARTVTDSCRVYMIAGEGIEAKHEPPDALVLSGEDAERLWSKWTTPKGENLEWGFIPVQGSLSMPEFNPLKRALIFEEPLPGYDYSLGFDTGTGVQRDRSALCVTRHGNDFEPDVQVAEFADDTVGNTEIYAWGAALCALYSTYMEDWPHPKLVIELRRKFGDMSYHQLRLMGFHRHHDFVPIDRKTFKPVPGKHGRPGWWTNAWSRPLLLGFFTSALENGWYEVRSKYLKQEIAQAEMRTLASGQTRMDHVTGKHDDRIFAAAMSYFTLHAAEVMAERSKRRYNAIVNSKLEIDYSQAGIMVQNCPEAWL
jgi:hypothetical protein